MHTFVGLLKTKSQRIIDSVENKSETRKEIVPMRTSTNIPSETLNAATAVLSPYVLGLSAAELLKALESYNEEGEASASKQNSRPQKPYTRKEAAEMLGVSLPTIDRYLASGHLTRVRYSARAIRISADSVHNLMRGEIE